MAEVKKVVSEPTFDITGLTGDQYQTIRNSLHRTVTKGDRGWIVYPDGTDEVDIAKSLSASLPPRTSI